MQPKSASSALQDVTLVMKLVRSARHAPLEKLQSRISVVPMMSSLTLQENVSNVALDTLIAPSVVPTAIARLVLLDSSSLVECSALTSKMA